MTSPPKLSKHDKYCPNCGHVGKPTVRGSLWITLILLLFWVVPGLIYEIWRCSGGRRTCTVCKCSGMIPVTSVVAANARAEQAMNAARAPQVLQ